MTTCHGRKRSPTLLFLLLLTLAANTARAYCPPPDSHEQQDKFYKCVRNMDNSDKDENDVLDPDEFEFYVRAMVFSLFVVPPFAVNDPLPHELQHDLFDILVNASGSVIDENGNPVIDVYGSSVYELPLIDGERMDALREMCWASVDALLSFGPQTAAPKKMVMENVKAQNNQAKVSDQDEIDPFANVLSIHSSFVIANYEGLEAHDLPVARDSVLSRSFVEFLLDLLDTECPNHGHYKECWDDPWASYDDALDEDGSLCGSHAEWVRRIFCGTRHRDLLPWDKEDKDEDKEPLDRIENVILYKVQDSRCPIPMISQGKGGGHAPKCQTIYAHYLLHLHDLDVSHKGKIEEVYVNITQAAIDNGMLQDALVRRDPDSVYIVEAAGPRVRPPEHKRHFDPFHRTLGNPCPTRGRELMQQFISWDS